MLHHGKRFEPWREIAKLHEVTIVIRAIEGEGPLILRQR